MKIRAKIIIDPESRTVKVQTSKEPEKEKLEGLSELAILGGSFMTRIVDGRAINVDDVRRYNALCYRLLGPQQDGGEFTREDQI